MAETLHNNGILINGMNELAGVYTETKIINLPYPMPKSFNT